ncbi:MAG: molybdopterin-dependent oxidoreductase [Dehalococcoidales bacterium]|nr:molybdopterin-dependent oxidoreductase [Dehalococcoidales bacterium]
MKNRFNKIIYLLCSLLMVGALVVGTAGCQSTNNTSSTSDQPATTSTSEQTVLTLVKGDQTVTYTMTSLKALPQSTGWAGQMSSTGTISGPFQYKGIALSELLKAVGGITENNAVRVSAKDGYAMTLSYKQITEGNFTIIDSGTGKEVSASNKPVVFIAYEEDGKAISENIGPLRLGIMTSNNQVTEGHWWVKWTQKIEVIAVQTPWTLKLEGIINENMDPATFESGSAIGCHGVKWTDDQNRVWEGIPLWYLVGRVDDTNTHKGDAFDYAAAEKGYEVHLIAKDGFTVKLTSQEVAKNNAIIVAYKRDGNPLPENQWPLRLVGATLEKSQMVGQITTIKLVFGTEATTAPTTTTESAAITVTKGTQTKSYTMTQLKALTPISGYSGTKNKAGVITGPLPYKGVALTDFLLNAVGGLSNGDSVKLTAKDGYAKTLTYDQILQGTFTTYDKSGNAVDPETKLVVFLAYEADGKALDESTGPIQLAIMTCQNQVTDGSNFVKQIEKIEVIAP